MATLVSALAPGLYTVRFAQIMFYPAATPEKGIQLGDTASGSIEVTAERNPINSNEDGLGQQVTEIVGNPTCTGNVEMRQHTDFNVALGLMGDAETFSQSSATDQDQQVSGVAVGDIIKVAGAAGRKVTLTAITDGAGTPNDYTLDTHYEFDSERGVIKILALPDTDTTLNLTYNLAEITNGAKAGIGSNTSIRGRLEIYGTTETGKQHDFVIWDAIITPGGAQTIVTGGTEVTTLPITFTANRDSAQAAGYELGQMIRTA